MRRIFAAAVVITVIVVVAISALGGSSGEDYRFDAVFDTSKGLVPGQAVKIAGTRVGRVLDVRLAPGPSARVSMRIPSRYAPFSRDARCRILPEGLISESYVECEPGRGRAPLAADRSGTPTVARARTAVPVSVQDLIEVFAAPTSERVRIVLNELGLATAGVGTDLNAVLRRANPSLTQARALLRRLDRQNETITDAVAQTDRVLASLTRDRTSVRRFVGRAADVAQRLAPEQAGISATLRGLPAMLDTADAALGDVRKLTTAATPVLRDVRAAAPALDAVTRSLPTLAARGRPAISELRRASRSARATVPRATALSGDLAQFARATRPVAPLLRDLLVSLRNSGGIESVLNLGYTLSVMSSGYDSISHMAGVFIGLAPTCIVSNLLNTPLPAGCDHTFGAPGRGTVPVNAPSAGPQDQRDSVLSDATARSGPARSKPPTPAQTRALLESLLG